ncbi:bifunctional apoptosis regulator isoform X1 [Tachysurus fulvidraco]|uniref:bifunctional apoptosis regulator isoform X1 n=2 Tax=Tachysurus fulvidraco TaxID=1234273 RepID=UPI000F4F2EA6|nr:bifunctional apoptosis regulator isoform X1 [Tachysurus fulvidraco]
MFSAVEGSTDVECEVPMSDPEIRTQSVSGESSVLECVLSCHCCYDVLVNPTTLTCGHSFCRHCLALWWESSHRTECPECREPWHGFPKVNILLRDAVEKLHGADVRRRCEEIQSNVSISRSLLAFQRFGDEQSNQRSVSGRAGSFCLGVFLTLSCIMVMLLMYRWSSGGIYNDNLVSKPISRWTVDDVTLWMEQLGSWTNQYRETFLQEQVNGRLLNLLGDDDLLSAPFLMENPSHRRALLQELYRVQSFGVKPPRDLWEYKAANEEKFVFLVYALKDSPRLTFLLLYLFDYEGSFLPLIHTCCPTHSEQKELTEWVWPSWWQWAWLGVKWLVVPYQLMAEFAFDWLSVHYWTSRIVIVNAVLLSLQEGHAVWSSWRRGQLGRLPHRVFAYVWRMGIHSIIFLFLWPLLPQCVWNALFYWGFYCSPAYNTHSILKQLLRHTPTHQA